MDYRFFLTNRKTGRKTEIQEPVKFDGFTPRIKRSGYYGMIPDESDTEIEFDRGAGYELLKASYEKYGVDTEIDFLCEYTCDGRAWEEYYSGQLFFPDMYEERYRNWCRIATKIMANDIRVAFLGKREDEIDLDSVVSRNGEVLKKYNNLGRNIPLPAKTIKVQNEVVQEYADSEEIEQRITVYRLNNDNIAAIGCLGSTMSINRLRSILHFRLNSTKYSEAGEVYEDLSVSHPVNDDSPAPAMYVSLSGISISNCVLDITIKGKISYDFQAEECGYIQRVAANNIKIITDETVHNIDGSFDASCGADVEFDFNTSIALSSFAGVIEITVDLEAWVVEGGVSPAWSCGELYQTGELSLSIDSGSYIRFTANSQFPATPAKTYLIHEALSRIAEYLTDGRLTVKSDFYGRTDSEIYPVAADGNAAPRAITNGYLIRRAVMTDGSTPKMFVSWKKLFESLQAIDNVGFCFEAGGIIRVEPMEYFYRDDIVMRCDDIYEYTKKFDGDSNIRSVKTGYKKWLSEEYNSIDGFHTTREYHTPAERSALAKEYLSELIADGYAIEATRRRQIGESSKDWQYDNDLFIIDLKRGGTDLEVNTGVSDTGGTLIDAGTVYNGRLSPARMAMQHFADMTKAVPPVNERILKFSASEGYSSAKMRAGGNYIIEKSVIVENQDISEGDFADSAGFLRDASPNLMTFKYPISPYEFRHIREHPYGLVDADGQLGWVRELEWETGKGTANFTLELRVN